MKARLIFISIIITLNACGSSQEKGMKSRRPNILFILADDASYPHMSAYGCDWIQTPAFDRVAKEGVLFNRAYTPNAKCSPSRSCVLTGRNSWQLEEAANHSPNFPEKFTTFPEALKMSGYHVGYTGKGWAPGNPGTKDGQPRMLTGDYYGSHKLTPPTAFISNEDYAANFEDFLNDKLKDEPFCFWMGSNEPHRGYAFKSGIDKGGKTIDSITEVPHFWPDVDSVRVDMLDYAFEVEYFDNQLEKVLTILEEAGELDNTIIVVTSDNGMPFPRVKGATYEISNHMPLAIMWKDGIKMTNRKVDDFVSFIDFAPTFLELAEVDPKDLMMPITGKSLVPILQSKDNRGDYPNRDFVLLGKERHDVGRPDDQGYPVRAIIKNDYLFLINFKPKRWPHGNPETGYLTTDGSPTKTFILNYKNVPGYEKFYQWSFGLRPSEELYNIKKDPFCINNLIGSEEDDKIAQFLKEELLKKLNEQGDPRMFGNGNIFDEYPYSADEHRGFYDRYLNEGEKIETVWVNESDFE
ncbi:sulfatase family protein [Echinicola shivajiensis]|uniref:sulfatase family protein n=1 Tax=Echinicola shivajiensis TaxID=1035916 RepID=UPI001BFCB86A|nr:sulfatase [Echinicola shivajiensis]